MKVKVHGLNSTKEFEEQFQDDTLTVLDVIERHGVKLPFGCRSGSCGVCRVTVKGSLHLLKPRGIVEEDTAARCHDPETIRLACQLQVLATAQSSEDSLEFAIAPEAVIPDES
jgi:ferredoxin